MVRGPIDSVSVRRKRRFAGIWLNPDRVDFHGVPTFYAVASSKPLNEIISGAQTREEIGIDTLQLVTADTDEDAGLFRRRWWNGARRRGFIAASPAA